ncbi:unnamed protein product [Closterium sp. NIES-54]
MPAATAASTGSTAPAPTASASPTVLTFDAEGRAVDFDVWVDDLQLFLQCDSRDGVSLFDHTSRVSTAPAATSDSAVRSQWTTRDAVSRLAVRSHLPPAERAHFGQYKTAKSLYDAVVARYSSLATAALSRLMLPYHFPDLATFAIVADLITHLRTSDAHYRAALPTEFCAKNPPPPHVHRPLLPIDLLEERLAAAEKSILAVGASSGDHRTPFFEGCSPVPLLPSVASFAAVDLVGTEEVGVASAPSGRRRNSKGKGNKGGRGDGRGGGGGGGAGESALSCTAPTEALHTFTLDSGASRSFFRDSTILTPLSLPVAVSLADPSGGPVLAHSSTVLPCPAAPSGLLSGLHLPLFSTNLVSGADLQDAWVAASCQVFAAASRSSPASAPCSCRPLAHETLLWHHHLGQPSLPRLRGMASRTLVSGLPRSLPPLPPGPAPTCVPCVEGRQRAAPHSSTFPPTEVPLQTLHMDVWGPARVRGQVHKRYFLLVVDDNSRYTTLFPLRSKGEVTEVLIDYIHAARCQLSERFGSDLPVLRPHSDRGGEFSSDLLRAFCRAEGICQTFTLPASP